MNRKQSRLAAKAASCMSRGTKIPGGVLAGLGERQVRAVAKLKNVTLKPDTRNGITGMFATRPRAQATPAHAA